MFCENHKQLVGVPSESETGRSDHYNLTQFAINCTSSGVPVKAVPNPMISGTASAGQLPDDNASDRVSNDRWR